jgi:hypothetical protein
MRYPILSKDLSRPQFQYVEAVSFLNLSYNVVLFWVFSKQDSSWDIVCFSYSGSMIHEQLKKGTLLRGCMIYNIVPVVCCRFQN